MRNAALLWLVAGYFPLLAQAVPYSQGPFELDRISFQQIKAAAGQLNAPHGAPASFIETPYPMKFIKIKGGKFNIGTDDYKNDPSFANAQPPSYPIILKDFALADTEVTVAQYTDCVKKKQCREPLTDSFGSTGNCNYGKAGRQNYPVNCVSWEDTQVFIGYLNSRRDGHTYRLPSEAEWEKAATDGKGKKYPWGDTLPDCAKAIMSGCSKDGTAGVRSLPAVRGLYGMAGNVWEWAQDRFHLSYEGIPADGKAWEDGEGVISVLRGGSFFNDDVKSLRAHKRAFGVSDDGDASFGFRLVRD